MDSVWTSGRNRPSVSYSSSRFRLFRLACCGVDYFPGYALDPSAGYRPAKGLTKVMGVFRGRKDDWGLAYWFATVNSFLGGKRPQDLLIDQPDRRPPSTRCIVVSCAINNEPRVIRETLYELEPMTSWLDPVGRDDIADPLKCDEWLTCFSTGGGSI